MNDASLPPLAPSVRSLFLRGDHSQTFFSDPASSGFLDGRPLADWCRERANGVPPYWWLAGVTYWVTVDDGKVRAFYRHEQRLHGGTRNARTVWCWRAIAAPTHRLLKMRLASLARLPVSAIETWPTFAADTKQ